MARILRTQPVESKYIRPVGTVPPLARITTPGQLQIKTLLASARHRRVTDVRRMPRQGYTPALATVKNSAGTAIDRVVYPKRLIGPRPPEVVREATVAPPIRTGPVGRARFSRQDTGGQRRSPNSKLSPPAVVTPAPTFVAEPLSVNLTRSWKQTRRFPPQVVAQSAGTVCSTGGSTSAVLDTFNRANENPLSDEGKWTSDVNSDDTGGVLTVSSNQCVGSTGDHNSSYWNVAEFCGYSEAFVTVQAINATLSRGVRVYCCIHNPGGVGTATSYFAELSFVSPGSYQIAAGLIRGGGFADVSQNSQATTFTAGDVLKVRFTPGGGISGAGLIEAFQNGVLKVSHSVVPGVGDPVNVGGFIGLGLYGTGTTVDDFGGGCYQVAAQAFTLANYALGPRAPLCVAAGTTFVAPPLNVNCLTPDRLGRRHRRQLPSSTLGSPILSTTQLASPIRVALVDARPRPRTAYVAPPQVTFAASAFDAPVQPPVRVRPRRTIYRLQPPTAVTTSFTALPVQVVQPFDHGRRRRRAFSTTLFPPTVLAVFAGPVAKLARTRPRPTRPLLRNFVVAATAQTFSGPTVVTPFDHGRRRRRPLSSALFPPTVLATQAFFGPDVTIVRARPRPTVARLTAIVYPAVEQTIAVAVVRARPPRTAAHLTATSYPQAGELAVTLVRARPRHTVTLLEPPATLEPFAAELLERTIRVELVRTRPRRTLGTRLTAVSYPATSEVQVTLVRIRPRPTRRSLTAVSYPQAGQVRVTVARTRPRATRAFLTPPTTLLTFSAGRAALTVVRPRRTRYVLEPPTVVTQPAATYPTKVLVALVQTRPRRRVASLGAPIVLVAPVEAPSLVALTKSRPRPTRTFVRQPATLQTFVGAKVTLVRVRPRPTARLLGEPTTLAVFAGPQVARVHTRPRPTVYAVRPPATLQPYAVTLAEDTVRVTVVRSRPRPTIRRLTAVSYPQSSAIRTTLVRTRPRPTVHSLTAISYPATGVVQVTLVKTRPRPKRAVLEPPTVLQTFATGRAQLVRSRPRHTTSYLYPAATLAPYAVVLAEETVRVVLVHTRPRRTVGTRLTSVSYPAVEQTVATALVRTRPRATRASLTAVSYPAFGELQVTLVRTRPRPKRVLLEPPTVLQTFQSSRPTVARIRPRHTVSVLAPPATLTPYAVVLAEDTIRVALAKTRPRHTLGTRLTAISYAATSSIRVALATTRPRPTRHLLTAISYAAVETTLAVTVVRVRPRPTTRSLTAVRYAQTSAVAVTLVHTRPRRPSSVLRPPATLQPYAVTLAEDTVRVTVVRTRPRHTLGTRLTATSYAATSSIQVVLVKTRPRPTRRILTAVSYPAVETTLAVALTRTRPRPTTRLLSAIRYAATSEITVTLVRTRPRPQRATLLAPTVLQTFETGQPQLVRTRPRPTRYFVAPPATLTPFVVELAEETVRVVLVRTRPRHTLGTRLTAVSYPAVETTVAVQLVRTLPRPTARFLTAVRYAATSDVQVTLVRIRPRPIRSTVGQPVVSTQTFDAATAPLVRVRPRPTRYFLNPPTVLAGSAVEQTVQVTLVRTRPRPTVARLEPPTALQVFTGPDTPFVRTRPRRRIARLGTAVVLQSFVVGEDKIRVSVVRSRPRPTRKALTAVRYAQAGQVKITVVRTRPRHTLGTRLTRIAYPAVEQTISVTLVRVRPRPTAKQLGATSYAAVEQQISVTTARIRPRPTARLLGEPQALTVFSGTRVALVHTTPRPTIALLLPPATLEPASVEQAERTIRVELVAARPRPVRSRLLPQAVVVAAFEGPQVTLATARPRPTRSFVSPPTALQTFAGPLVVVVRIRPRRRISLLRAPVAFRSPTFRGPQVVLVHTRPRHTVARLSSVRYQPLVTDLAVTLVQTRPRPTTWFLPPPTVVEPASAFPAAHVTATRIRPAKTHATLVPPTVVITTHSGEVTGYTAPDAASEGTPVPESSSDGYEVPEDGSTVRDAPDAAADASTSQDAAKTQGTQGGTTPDSGASSSTSGDAATSRPAQDAATSGGTFQDGEETTGADGRTEAEAASTIDDVPDAGSSIDDQRSYE